MRSCGHCCCQIKTNEFHDHIRSPQDCDRCGVTLCASIKAAAGQPPPDLAQVTESVLNRVVPEIPGLPTGRKLDRLVKSTVRAVYLAGLSDPELHAIDLRVWRTVLAGRVGIALAFRGRW